MATAKKTRTDANIETAQQMFNNLRGYKMPKAQAIIYVRNQMGAAFPADWEPVEENPVRELIEGEAPQKVVIVRSGRAPVVCTNSKIGKALIYLLGDDATGFAATLQAPKHAKDDPRHLPGKFEPMKPSEIGKYVDHTGLEIRKVVGGKVKSSVVTLYPFDGELK